MFRVNGSALSNGANAGMGKFRVLYFTNIDIDLRMFTAMDFHDFYVVFMLFPCFGMGAKQAPVWICLRRCESATVRGGISGCSPKGLGVGLPSSSTSSHAGRLHRPMSSTPLYRVHQPAALPRALAAMGAAEGSTAGSRDSMTSSPPATCCTCAEH